MKKTLDSVMNRLVLFIALMMGTVYSFAQEGGNTPSVDITTSTTRTTTTDWYTQPWVWIVGGLVFILLLAALLSGGRSRRSDGTTIHRTTYTRRDDVIDA